MTSVSGFIIFDKEFISSIEKCKTEYLNLFINVFIKRIQKSQSITSWYIFQPSDNQIIHQDLFDNPDFCIIHNYDGKNVVTEIVAKSKKKKIEQICVISPKSLLVSDREIEVLIAFHKSSKNDYSFNHKPFGFSNYPRGIGAEIINADYLSELLVTQQGNLSWDELIRTIPEGRKNRNPLASDSISGPEIDLTVEGLEKFHKISCLISTLESLSKTPDWETAHILKTYRDIFHIKTILILERTEDIPAAQLWAKNAGGEICFVSLYPDVSYSLDKLGIPFSSFDDYFEVENANLLVDEKSGSVEKLCYYLDEKIRQKYPGCRINPAYGAFSQMRLLHDVIFIYTSILKNIIRKNTPDSIRFYSGNPNTDPLPFGFAFTRQESVYVYILTSCNWKIPVCIIPCKPDLAIQNKSSLSTLFGIKTCIVHYLKKIDFLFNAGILIKNHGPRIFFSSLFYSFTNNILNQQRIPVVIYGGGYNWDHSLPHLYQRGITRIIRLDDLCLISQAKKDTHQREDLSEFIVTLCKNSDLARELSYIESVDVSEFFFSRIAQIVNTSYDISCFTYEKARSIFKTKNVKCLLLCTRSTPVGKSVVMAAKDAEIPIISWQHGGTGFGYDPMMYHDEIVDSDVHLVFGNQVSREYEKLILENSENNLAGKKQQPHTEIHVVGSSILDAIRPVSSTKIQKKTIVYITTLFRKNDYLNMWIYLNRTSPNEDVWAFQKKVLDLAILHPDYHFIIKLHPIHKTREPLRSYIADYNITNVDLIVDEKSVNQLIHEGDLFIFDTISTGILQALTSEKDIFVYSGTYKIFPQVISLLKQRAFVSDIQEDCISMLHDYLEQQMHAKNLQPDRKNKDFIKEFGTYLNDGRSAERAVDDVLHLVRKAKR